MAAYVKVGEKVPTALQLADGAPNKYVRAWVYGAAGNLVQGPLALTHVADGLYITQAVTMPNEPFLAVKYRVYDDPAFTTLSIDHSDSLDMAMRAQDLAAATSSLSTQISSATAAINAQILDSAASLNTQVLNTEDNLSTQITALGSQVTTSAGSTSTQITNLGSTLQSQISTSTTSLGTQITNLGSTLGSQITASTSSTGAQLSSGFSDVESQITAAKNALSTQITGVKEELLDTLSHKQSRVKLAVSALVPTDELEFQVWLNLDGQPVPDATSAALTVFGSDGVVAFTLGPSTFKSSIGVFKLVRGQASTTIAAGRAYTVYASVIRGSATYASVTSITVF